VLVDVAVVGEDEDAVDGAEVGGEVAEVTGAEVDVADDPPLLQAAATTARTSATTLRDSGFRRVPRGPVEPGIAGASVESLVVEVVGPPERRAALRTAITIRLVQRAHRRVALTSFTRRQPALGLVDKS
jgi:hypothetical protein